MDKYKDDLKMERFLLVVTVLSSWLRYIIKSLEDHSIQIPKLTYKCYSGIGIGHSRVKFLADPNPFHGHPYFNN